MRKIYITENQLNTIRKGLLKESQMKELYHFTKMPFLDSILKSNNLIADTTQKKNRNGKNYISLTRHKTVMEGFGFVQSCDVRLTLDAEKLQQKNTIRPFEFYSPKPNVDKEWGDIEGNDEGMTAKSRHAKYRFNDKYDMGDFEYYNQAEESLETDQLKIDNISNYLIRIDVLCDFTPYSNKDTKAFLKQAVIALNGCKGTEAYNKIRVYTSFKDFNYQTNKCISPEQFLRKFGKGVDTKDTKKDAMKREETIAWAEMNNRNNILKKLRQR